MLEAINKLLKKALRAGALPDKGCQGAACFKQVGEAAPLSPLLHVPGFPCSALLWLQPSLELEMILEFIVSSPMEQQLFPRESKRGRAWF